MLLVTKDGRMVRVRVPATARRNKAVDASDTGSEHARPDCVESGARCNVIDQ